MLAAPETSAVAAEVYVPLLSVTVPVGVAVTPDPEAGDTVMPTESYCAVVMLEAVGVTVTVGMLAAVVVSAGAWYTHISSSKPGAPLES